MRASRVSVSVAAFVAVAVGVSLAGCTSSAGPEDIIAPSVVSSSAVVPVVSAEELDRLLPLDGSERSPITWDLSGVQRTDEVLVARRSIAFDTLISERRSDASVVSLGRHVYTPSYYDRQYKELEASRRTAQATSVWIGPRWVKFMGVRQSAADRAVVSLCDDTRRRHYAGKQPEPSELSLSVVAYVVQKVQAGNGENRWLIDDEYDMEMRTDPGDGPRARKFVAECKKWAKHRP